MTCKELESLTTEYLEETLSATRRQDFEAHLATCPKCQKYLAEMRALIEASHKLGGKLTDEWRARAAETQGEFFEKLQARARDTQEARKQRYRRLAPAAAVVAAVAIVAGVWLYQQPGHKSRDLTIDLSHWVRPRGAEQQPNEQRVQLERARLNLTIRLPIGEEPGEYQVALRRGGSTVVQGRSAGKLEDQITTLHLQFDCSSLSSGTYVLAIREDERAWEEFPALVR
jgi:putative zinc finger protein